MSFIIKGLIFGFSIAAPVGPIGILCIRKTLQFGRLSGLYSGLGAAFADMIYGIIAVFGLGIISKALLSNQFLLRLIGGAFLVYLGIKTFFSKIKEANSEKIDNSSLFKDFITTFFLTITNPMTILSFIAIFAGLGVSEIKENYFNAISLILGVFLGSAAWWLLLSEFVTLFRKKVEKKMMLWINRGAGIIIFLFGIFALIISFI
jgi:threonine/homoserine/homoserine lactone efflux protein